MSNKVFIIGLDGATFDLLIPWMEHGYLPNLAQIYREGCWGYLKSTVPPNTAVAWSSFISGKNPGNTGIFDFHYRTPGSYHIQFINARCIRGKSLWRILGDHGKRVDVVNMPVTYPAEEVNGFLISGLMTPDVNEKMCYPRDLLHELTAKFGNLSIKVYTMDYVRHQKFDQLFEQLMKLMEQRYAITTYLMDKRPWDFFCLVFTATDAVQHTFWRHMDTEHPLHDPGMGEKFGGYILRLFQKADAMVGELMEKLDEDTYVIIMSDHGMGGNSNKAVYLNNWLAQEGFLAYYNHGWSPKAANDTIGRGFLRRLILLSKKYVPRDIKNKIKKNRFVKSKGYTFYRFPNIDWKHTRAFSDDKTGTIWLNLKGKFPQGAIEPGEEAEALRDTIIERARNFLDPDTQKPIFQMVLKKEDVYYGELLDQGPDIVLLQGNIKYNYVHRLGSAAYHRHPLKSFAPDQLVNEPLPTANHRPYGIFMIKGPGVKKGHQIKNGEIIDLAPTVLYLMGVPIPDDMDGKILKDTIEDNYLLGEPIYTKAEMHGDAHGDQLLSADEMAEIKEHLRGLGYLE